MVAVESGFGAQCCQLKVIDHVAFIMPPSGGRGQHCAMCGCACIHVYAFYLGMGEELFQNSEQWECTVDPRPTPRLSLDICMCMSYREMEPSLLGSINFQPDTHSKASLLWNGW